METEQPKHKEDSDVSQDVESDDKRIVLIKSFKYRWIILILYGLSFGCNGGSAASVYMITDTACKFYGVSKSMLLAAANIGNGIAVIALVAATFIPSKYGLQTAVVLASGISALGGAFFIAASHSSGFYWFIASEIFFLTAAGLLTPLVVEISAVWFPAHQHVLATSLGLQMPAFGSGLCSVEIMLLFDNVSTMQLTTFGAYFKLLAYCNGGLCIFFFLLILFFYKDMPKYPPSLSQAKRSGPGEVSFSECLVSFHLLIRNWRFLVLANVYGICFALGIVVPLLVNSLITPKYKNGDELVGELVLMAITSGGIGTFVFGALLDKTKHYKGQNLIHLAISVALWVVFTELLQRIVSFYIICILWILFWFVNLVSVGLMAEVIVEVTYPIPSSTPLVLSSIIGTLYGVTITQISGWLVDKHRENLICWILTGAMILAFILLAGVRVDQKRSMLDNKCNFNGNMNGADVAA